LIKQLLICLINCKGQKDKAVTLSTKPIPVTAGNKDLHCVGCFGGLLSENY